MVHPAHYEQDICIGLLNVKDICILQSRGTQATFAYELHYYNIILEEVRLRRLDESISHIQALKVADLLFRPELHHLTGV